MPMGHPTIKTVLFMLMLAALHPHQASARQVSEEQAAATARMFLSQRGIAGAMHQAPRRAPRRVPAPDVDAPYYIFNVGSGEGYVVVSGDDRTAAILGYADHGSLDGKALPDALCYLLDGYAQQIAWLDANPQPRRAEAPAVRTPIAPLLQTQWNQGSPYNSLCPLVTYATDDAEVQERAVTGCVATSMAKVMNYHQWPAAATVPLPAYTTRTLNLEVPALKPTTFSWDAMTNSYSGTSSTEAQTAVATLMQHCGTALQMDYNRSGAGGSSAYYVSVAEALRLYFGYDSDVCYVQRHHYSYLEWVGMIYAELAA